MRRHLFIVGVLCGSLLLCACGAVNSGSTGSGGGGGTAQQPATHFSVTAPANTSIGASFSFTVVALDASNAPVTTYTGTVKFTSTDAQAVLPAPASLTNGSGTFSATLNSSGGQTITVTDTTASSVTGTTSSISVVAPLAITSGALPNGTATQPYGTTQIPYQCIPNPVGGWHFVCKPCIPVPGIVTCTPTWRDHVQPGFVLSASAGAPPYSWTWAPQAGSSLPLGLNLDSEYGIISGTPRLPGTYSVTITVSDANFSHRASANYTMVIAVPPPPAVSTSPAPSIGTLNSPYNSTFAATGGLPPLTFSETGALPNGLSLSPTGLLSGTPTQAGEFAITITAQDAAAQNSAPQPFTIQVLSQGFSVTGSMGTARVYHTATLLGSGKVLVTGGASGSADLSSAELYDPASGAFSSTGSMETARVSHTATLLKDGTVLIAGGYGSGPSLSSAEIFDPAAGAFTPTGNMNTARSFHTATLLQDGRVLVTGGEDGSGGVVATAEIYDPSSKTFSPTGSMANIRMGHTATLLASGKVLIAGGNPNPIDAELFDPATGTFSSAGAMQAVRIYHAATLLNDGRVLITGGTDQPSAEIYDPNAGTFSATGNMASSRSFHTATLLTASGKVLVTGGTKSNTTLSSSELFDPTGNSFTPTANLISARFAHSATLLNNGEVLVIGGFDANNQPLATAELYQ